LGIEFGSLQLNSYTGAHMEGWAHIGHWH